jgi:two-component system chemotaxis response regulator CheB
VTIRAAVATSAQNARSLCRALEQDRDITVLARIDQSQPQPLPPDTQILVVDLASLGDAGLRLVQTVMGSTPIPVLALCPDDDPDQGVRALARGAVAAVSRDAALEHDGSLLRLRTLLVSGVGVVRRFADSRVPRHTAGPASIVAIGASAGGPAALARLLGALGGIAAPVLVVQHLHQEFMGGFVAWLANQSALPVAEAQDAERVRSAQVYLAPAGRHLRLTSAGTVSLDELPVSLHRPSADELLGSVASAAGTSGVGVILTGMGRDGAAGLLAMRRAGARTFVQDEASCAVFGMPRAALDIGAVDRTTPLDQLAATILGAVRGVTP